MVLVVIGLKKNTTEQTVIEYYKLHLKIYQKNIIYLLLQVLHMQVTFLNHTFVIFNFSDVPETQITLGTNLRADDIREGTDVYFDCTVDAVPPAYKVQWKRDVCNSSTIVLYYIAT